MLLQFLRNNVTSPLKVLLPKNSISLLLPSLIISSPNNSAYIPLWPTTLDIWRFHKCLSMFFQRYMYTCMHVCAYLGSGGENFSPSRVPSGSSSGRTQTEFEPLALIWEFAGFQLIFFLIFCTLALMLISEGEGYGCGSAGHRRATSSSPRGRQWL